MKNIVITTILALVLCLLVTHKATSQILTENGRNVNFGVKGGGNQVNHTGSEIGDIDSRTGYQFGIFMSIDILEELFPDIRNLQMRIEVNYRNTGSKIIDNQVNRALYDGIELFMDEELHGFELVRDTGGPFAEDEIFDENVYSNVTYHMVEVPFRFTYSFPFGTVVPYILAGPTFSVVADYDHDFTLITEDGTSYTQADIPEIVNQQFNKINVSADTGIGVRLPYGLFLEGYYSHGFINQMKFYENSMYQRGFVANFGIQF